MTEITIKTDDLMSVQDAARMCGHHRYQIYRWIKSGKIRAIKLGGTLFVVADEIKQLKQETPKNCQDE